MNHYIIDTNIISTIMNAKEEVAQLLKNKIINKILKGDKLYIHILSYYEIKRGLLSVRNPKSKNIKEKLKKFTSIISQFEILFLNKIDIMDKAAIIYSDLKKEGNLISNDEILDVDIIIGATAVLNDYICVTNNIKHFNRIMGIKLENWLNR